MPAIRMGIGSSGDPNLEEPAVVDGSNILLWTSLTGVFYPGLEDRGIGNFYKAPTRQFVDKHYVVK